MPPNLNPFAGGFATSRGPVKRPVFDTFTGIDGSGRLQPALAASWRNTSPTTWEIKLRPDVKFQNGEPVDVESAEYSVIQMMQSSDAGRIATFASVTPIDRETLRITTKAPDPIVPTRLGDVPLVPQKYFASVGPDRFGEAPVGTGPFRVTEFKANRHIIYEAVESSWRGIPQLKELRILRMDESASRVQALRAGDIDVAALIPADSADSLRGGGFRVLTSPEPRTALVQMRQSQIPDRRIRQAFNYAVDKQAIMSNLLRGFARPTNGNLVGEECLGYNPDLKPYPYDVERAKSLLEAAGLPANYSVQIDIAPQLTDIAQAVAAYLTVVGVKVSLQETDLAQQQERRNNGTGGALNVWVPSYDPAMDADYALQWFTNVRPKSRFSDPRTDELFKQSRSEMDAAKRLKILQEMAAVFREEAPCIYLCQLWRLDATSPKVTGWEMRGATPSFDRVSKGG